MTAAVNRCGRGPRCNAWQHLEHPDGTRERVGAVCDRALCDLCERRASEALDDAPDLYRRLRGATLTRAQAASSEQVTVSRGSPMPLNTAALHLGEQLRDLLEDGEDTVRFVARLTAPVRSGKREGRRVADAAHFLALRLSAWVTADPDAVGLLLDWRSAVRRLPGFDTQGPRAVRRYTQRCAGCGIRAITHRAGDDDMQCQSCGQITPYLPTLPPDADYRVDQEVG